VLKFLISDYFFYVVDETIKIYYDPRNENNDDLYYKDLEENDFEDLNSEEKDLDNNTLKRLNLKINSKSF